MTPADLMNEFLKLSEEARNHFLASMRLYCDLHLPDGNYLILTKNEFEHGFAPNERQELYDFAREACHQFGIPWTDPRTGKTHEPPSADRKKL
jgi:hypothetical protein